jgi:hypothetical protein
MAGHSLSPRSSPRRSQPLLSHHMCALNLCAHNVYLAGYRIRREQRMRCAHNLSPHLCALNLAAHNLYLAWYRIRRELRICVVRKSSDGCLRDPSYEGSHRNPLGVSSFSFWNSFVVFSYECVTPGSERDRRRLEIYTELCGAAK